MTEPNPTVVCPTGLAVMRVLFYFEIFQYPLTAEEVFAFADCPDTAFEEIAGKLREMTETGQLFRFGDYYQTQNHYDWLPRRLEANRRADEFLPLARRMARFIGGFPFVRGVFVSGSLSKHCMSTDSDIDFFLITAPGRLWLARTLLVVFKKIFLFNSHKYFCVNYFVDTQHLKIEEQNIFSATETVTLLPMYGREWFEQFRAANPWAWALYPNFPLRDATATPPHQRGFFKKTAEWLLGGRLGNWLDRGAMRLTVGYWKRKFRHFDRGDFEVALKSRRYVSKHHPLFFQKKVLDALAARMRGLEVE